MEAYSLAPEAHHYLGIEMNQQVWKLLVSPTLDDKDTRRMEHFALASLYHWERSPNFAPINAQRGYWLLARVYAVLQRGDEALTHAQRCMALTTELELQDFDRAYAFEAMARAHAAAGDPEHARDQYQKARLAGEGIAKEQDKTIFMGDLEMQPWFEIEPPSP